MKICMGCMKEIEEDARQCPYCGFCEEEYKNSGYALPPHTLLHNRYVVGKVIGEGGFGITYVGYDTTLKVRVAIKEYYPNSAVNRNTTDGTTEVTIYANSRFGVDFEKNLAKVLDEARAAAKFREMPGIVSVHDFFQENGTAYIIMEFVEGQTLQQYCKDHLYNEITLMQQLVPVLDALDALHQDKIIHRDISPDNIMVTPDGRMKLLDFGAARGFSQTQNIPPTAILKRSYAPVEQHSNGEEQGPWTDIYALCATIYETLSGVRAPESLQRLIVDKIRPLSDYVKGIDPAFSDAIMKGLAVMPADRWQSIADFKEAIRVRDGDSDRTMYVGRDMSQSQVSYTATTPIKEPPKSEKHIKRPKKAAIAGVALLLAGILCFILISNDILPIDNQVDKGAKSASMQSRKAPDNSSSSSSAEDADKEIVEENNDAEGEGAEKLDKLTEIALIENENPTASAVSIAAELESTANTEESADSLDAFIAVPSEEAEPAMEETISATDDVPEEIETDETAEIEKSEAEDAESDGTENAENVATTASETDKDATHSTAPSSETDLDEKTLIAKSEIEDLQSDTSSIDQKKSSDESKETNNNAANSESDLKDLEKSTSSPAASDDKDADPANTTEKTLQEADEKKDDKTAEDKNVEEKVEDEVSAAAASSVQEENTKTDKTDDAKKAAEKAESTDRTNEFLSSVESDSAKEETAAADSTKDNSSEEVVEDKDAGKEENDTTANNTDENDNSVTAAKEDSAATSSGKATADDEKADELAASESEDEEKEPVEEKKEEAEITEAQEQPETPASEHKEEEKSNEKDESEPAEHEEETARESTTTLLADNKKENTSSVKQQISAPAPLSSAPDKQDSASDNESNSDTGSEEKADESTEATKEESVSEDLSDASSDQAKDSKEEGKEENVSEEASEDTDDASDKKSVTESVQKGVTINVTINQSDAAEKEKENETDSSSDSSAEDEQKAEENSDIESSDSEAINTSKNEEKEAAETKSEEAEKKAEETQDSETVEEEEEEEEIVYDNFNPFDYVKVTYSGIEPSGSVNIEVLDDDMDGALRYSISKSDDLKNGDKLTLKVSARGSAKNFEEYCKNTLGLIPEETTHEYVVEGLPHYAESTSEISDDLMDSMINQISDTIEASTANWRNTTYAETVEYVGYYFLSVKEGQEKYLPSKNPEYNRLYLVYRVDCVSDLTDDNGDEVHAEDSYLTTYYYSNILVGDNSDASVDIASYDKPDSILDLQIGDTKYTMGVSGYADLGKLRIDAVTRNLENYTYEYDIDTTLATVDLRSLVNRIPAEKPIETTNTSRSTGGTTSRNVSTTRSSRSSSMSSGNSSVRNLNSSSTWDSDNYDVQSEYYIEDSSIRALTVSDISNMSIVELQMAINEIYARHGYIFRDPSLQQYFNSLSWYTGTTPANQFNSSVLSATEKQNIELLMKEETKSPDFIIPDSSTRLLEKYELVILTPENLQTAINEIYGRHGYKFTTAGIAEWFNSKSWYHGTVDASSFNENVFSSIEKQNLELMKQVRESNK